MPIYLQIILLLVAFVIFVFLVMYLTGLGMRRLCFKIITEMEESHAFSAAKAVKIQEDRQNSFKVGTKNLRPRALNVLIGEGLVIKAPNGKYYLDKEKLSEIKKVNKYFKKHQ